MEAKVEAGLQCTDRMSFSSPAARAQAIEKLMAKLETDMQNPDANAEAVQGIMGELLELKRSGEVLERLRTEAGKPGALWEPVRGAMAELWALKRDLLVEILPTILNG